MKQFKGRDIISIMDFSKEEIMYILTTTEKIKKIKDKNILSGKILATLFYEPSTRTKLSFESAMNRLGGKVLGFSSGESTSVAKGENLADTIRTISCYSDTIVLRHHKEGAARLAAEFSDIPLINAGDGAGQHPTQTLLDLYTILSEKHNEISENVITILGDLKYSRTVHSLTHALVLFKPILRFVSPPELKLPEEILSYLDKNKIDYIETDSINNVIKETDVLYVTRIQKERFPDISEYLKVAGTYKITTNTLSEAKDSLIIMHPLPRVDEISPEVDNTKYAVYFKQVLNGVIIRMSVLSLVMGGIE